MDLVVIVIIRSNIANGKQGLGCERRVVIESTMMVWRLV